MRRRRRRPDVGAAGEADLYLLAEAVSDDLVFVNTAPHTLSPPAP